MQKVTQALLAILVSVTVIGCGTNTPGTSNPNPTQSGPTKLNGVEYVVIDKGTLTSADASVTGTGSLVFKTPLVKDDNNFELNTTLEDGGSVTLSTNATGALKDGVNVSFARTGLKVKVVLSAKDETYDLSEDFSSLVGDKPIKVAIDIHQHGHAIVDGVGGGELEYAFKHRATGKSWGLTLVKATVTQAKQGEPKHPH